MSTEEAARLLNVKAAAWSGAAPADDKSESWDGGGSAADSGAGGGGPHNYHHTRLDSVQFSATQFFCSEGEGHAVLEVMRIGSRAGRCLVRYSTEDSSAKAGHRYVPPRGQEAFLEFSPGQATGVIEIPILHDEAWNATLEFRVTLGGAEGCVVNKYFGTCRVKVIDEGVFPTNRFGKVIRAGLLTEVPPAELLKEYIKMNLMHPTVRKGALRVVLSDQVDNLIFIMNMLLMLFLVDHVLIPPADAGGNVESQHARIIECVLIGILLCLPVAVQHYLDYRKVFWKIGGTSRMTIQANLLRKFLSYEEDTRSELKESYFLLAMTSDTQDLVGKGFMQIFPLIQNLGRLAMVSLTALGVNLFALLPICLFPLAMGAFLRARNALSVQLTERQNHAQKELISHVDNTIATFRLLADYNKRSFMVDSYEGRIGAFNRAATAKGAVSVNNRYFAPWVSQLVRSLFVIIAGDLLITTGNPTLGTLLATLEMFGSLGQAFAALYKCMLEMQDSFPALLHICHLMNLPVEDRRRMEMSRARLEMGRAAWEQARLEKEALDADMTRQTSGSGLENAADRVRISVDNVEFEFATVGDPLHHVVCSHQEIRQGQFCVVAGMRGVGKSTFLRILGGVLLPKSGQMFVPPHLRLLHVSQEASFLDAGFLQNLAFGVAHPGDPDGSKERILGICDRLSVPPKVLSIADGEQHQPGEEQDGASSPGSLGLSKYVQGQGQGQHDDAHAAGMEGACRKGSMMGNASKKDENKKGAWADRLSFTERVSLNLARALVANPDVLVVHKPTLGFDEQASLATMQLLREFVEQRGVLQDEGDLSHRHPRTCIMTISRASEVAFADRVFLVEDSNVRELAKADVTPDMLE